MKVEIVNSTTILGVEYKSGDLADLPGGLARDLVNAGKARFFVELRKAAKTRRSK